MLRWVRWVLVATTALAATAANCAALVTLIQRDHTGNLYATDRYWFYKNLDGSEQTDDPKPGNGRYNDLEYDASRSWQIDHVVYRRAWTITMRLRFKNLHRNAITANLHFSAFRLKVPPAWDRPNVTFLTLAPPADQQFTMAAWGGTADVTIQVTGLPDYVTLGDIQWQGEVTAISGYPPGENIWVKTVDPDGWGQWERVNAVDSDPQNMQSTPWTDLLDYACSWAHGKHGDPDVPTAVTNGMFFGSSWLYDGRGVWFWEDPRPSNDWTTTYQLKRALGDPTSIYMDCRDVSGFNGLAIEALGYTVDYLRIFNISTDDGFLTNPICGIGGDPSDDDDYSQFPWAYHQITWRNAYDAAAAQKTDLSGNEYRKPPACWDFSGFWQQANPNPPPPFWGLVFGIQYGTPSVVQPSTAMYQIRRIR
jgi:hypothetical protein